MLRFSLHEINNNGRISFFLLSLNHLYSSTIRSMISRIFLLSYKNWFYVDSFLIFILMPCHSSCTVLNTRNDDTICMTMNIYGWVCVNKNGYKMKHLKKRKRKKEEENQQQRYNGIHICQRWQQWLSYLSIWFTIGVPWKPVVMMTFRRKRNREKKKNGS